MKLFSLIVLATTAMAAEETHEKAAIAPMANSKSVIVIEPKSRAADFLHAFDLLRKDKPTLKITIRTTNAMLGNVSEVVVSPNGTLLMIKYASSTGTKYQVVPIEELVEIGYSPT